jgi:hypothetical protein
MGMSKSDLTRKHSNLVRKLAELEEKARMDPLGRDKRLHEEIAEIKKKLEKD